MKRARALTSPPPPLVFGPSSIVFPSPERILQAITAMPICPLSVPEIARIVVDFAKPGWLEITGAWEGVPSATVRLRASPIQVFVSESADDNPEPAARCFDPATGEFLPPVIRTRAQPRLADCHGGVPDYAGPVFEEKEIRSVDPYAEDSAAILVRPAGIFELGKSNFGFRHPNNDILFQLYKSGRIARWEGVRRGRFLGFVPYREPGDTFRGMCRISDTELMIVTSDDGDALWLRCYVTTTDGKTKVYDIETDFDETDSPRWWRPDGALETVPYRGGMLAVVTRDVYAFHVVGNACRIRRWPFPLPTRATNSSTALRVLGDDLFVSDVSRVWRLSLNAMPPSTAPFRPVAGPELVTSDKIVVPGHDCDS